MRLVKKYTIMIVPFSQKKVISFSITNVAFFLAASILFLFFTFAIGSLFSENSPFSLKESQLNNMYIKDTISLFSDKYGKTQDNYYQIKKNVEKFVKAYYPIFYDRHNITGDTSFFEDIDFLITTLSQYSNFYSKFNEYFATIPSIFPVVGGGKVTSGFGTRSDPFTMSLSVHTGVDIPKFPGTPIKAAGHGKVAVSGFLPGYGFVVKLRHANGFISLYAHQISMPLVRDGDEVKQGQIIGYVGSTGRSVGYHLHYEVRIEDPIKKEEKFLDPVDYLFLKAD